LVVLFFLGKMNSSDYSDKGPKWSFLNERLFHPLLAHGPGPFHGWGFLRLSLRVEVLEANLGPFPHN